MIICMRGDEKRAAFHFEKCPVPTLPPYRRPSFSRRGGDDLRVIKFAGAALWGATMAVSFRAFVSAGKISRGGNIAPRDVDTASHVDLFSLLPQRAEDKSIARAREREREREAGGRPKWNTDPSGFPQIPAARKEVTIQRSEITDSEMIWATPIEQTGGNCSPANSAIISLPRYITPRCSCRFCRLISAPPLPRPSRENIARTRLTLITLAGVIFVHVDLRVPIMLFHFDSPN